MRNPAVPPPSTRRLEWLLAAVALLCLGLWSWAQIDASAYNIVQNWRLDGLLAKRALLRSRPSSVRTAVATRDEAAASGLVGRIDIPRLGIHVTVSEGIDSRTLRRALGHVPKTAFPGEPGNVVIAGHRDSWFGRLREARPGDRVCITTPDGVFEYRVDSRDVVQPERTEVMAPTNTPTLTLITCYPFHYLGPAPERFVVRARQVPESDEDSGTKDRCNAPASTPAG